MSNVTYSVLHGEEVLAKGMSLPIALILSEAFLEKTNTEIGVSCTIKKEELIAEGRENESSYSTTLREF